MPVLSTIAAIAGIGAAGVGSYEAVNSGGAQQDAINSQLDIAKQEEARKQSVYNQLQPFYSQYTKEGSPFLAQQQRASAEQNATQFNNAAGQVRNTMQASGLGYGPSGATAAAISGLGAEAAKSSASSYLTNLLNNEQLKFQAAQGISGLANGPQISPQPGQYPINPIPGSITDFGTALQNLFKTLSPSKAGPSGSPVTPGGPNIPAFSPGQNLPNLGIGLPGSGSPTTQGTTGGGWD
jgi:hypothetical protein